MIVTESINNRPESIDFISDVDRSEDEVKESLAVENMAASLLLVHPLGVSL